MNQFTVSEYYDPVMDEHVCSIGRKEGTRFVVTTDGRDSRNSKEVASTLKHLAHVLNIHHGDVKVACQEQP